MLQLGRQSLSIQVAFGHGRAPTSESTRWPPFTDTYLLEPVEDQENTAYGQGDIDGDGDAPHAEAIPGLRNVYNAGLTRAPPPPGRRLGKIPNRDAMPLHPSLPLQFAKAIEKVGTHHAN